MNQKSQKSKVWSKAPNFQSLFVDVLIPIESRISFLCIVLVSCGVILRYRFFLYFGENLFIGPI